MSSNNVPGLQPNETTEKNLEAGSARRTDAPTNGPGDSTSGRSRLSLHRRWGEEISLKHVDVIPITCALISGFVDSTMFNAFGTFVSMQTGNTVFVALGASGQNPQPYGWAKSLMAVICFMIGSFCFSRFARALGSQRRISLVSSFLAQALFVLISAAITESGAVNGKVPSSSSKTIDWRSLAPVALLSFQSAGQIVEARNLGIGEVPTVVITSLLCDLWSDPGLFDPWHKNLKRNRRVIAFVLTLVGAIAGGWMSKETHNVASALWLVGGLKMLIAGAWVIWPSKKEDKEG